jgi:hypothetical protein
MNKITMDECYLCRNCKTIARLLNHEYLQSSDQEKLVAIALTLSCGRAVPADYAALEHINGKYPVDDFLQ